jgi:hypothetical protein
MPVYSNTVPPTTLFPGQQGLFFDAETGLSALVPVASIPFGLANSGPYGANAPSCSIEVLFAAAPGAFEIDIQDADTDTNNYYQTLAAAGVINAVDSTYFTARVELSPIKGRFTRLVVVTLTNNVALTARLTR